MIRAVFHCSRDRFTYKKTKKYFTKGPPLCIIAGQSQSDPLAQLEERYLDVVEVIGSSPIGIIIFLFFYFKNLNRRQAFFY